MVGQRQNRDFLGIKGLTDSQVKVIKELAVWPFHMRIASYFNIAQKTGLSDTHVSRCLRILNARGMVAKSMTGSWHLNPAIQKQLNAELEGRRVEPTQQQQTIVEKNKSEETVDLEKELERQFRLSNNMEEKLEKEAQNNKEIQNRKNASRQIKKKHDASKYKRKAYK